MAVPEAPELRVKKSMRTSLICFVLGLLAVTSTVFAFANSIIEKNELEQRTRQVSVYQMRSLESYASTVLNEITEGERAMLTNNYQRSDILLAVGIYSADGELKFSVVKSDSTQNSLALGFEQGRTQGSEAVIRTKYSVIRAAPFDDGRGNIIAWGVVETPDTAISQSWTATLLWSVGLGALICALAVPVVILLVNYITRPLYRLIDFASRLNANQLSARVQVDSGTEFDLLGDAFNKMLHRVEGTMRQVQRLAFVDSVTDLPNRERFIRLLNKALNERTDEDFTAVVILNVDRFRWVNETLGPQKGDEALSLIGLRIRKALHTADRMIRLENAQSHPSVVARLGGDEFAVLVPDIDAKSDITRLMQMVISSMRQPLEIAGQAITLGLSGGIALAPIHGVKGEDLMKNADLALKEARRAGRSKARFYSTKLNKIAMDRMHLEADLRRGIEKDEFIPYFQAKVDFKTGRISGAEALVRWQRDDGDLISPGIFIPMAEQLGLISAIGESVLRQACTEATRWMKAGHDCKVAVNVSPLQFEEADFAEKVLSSLREAGLPPGRLELEITETMAVADTDRVSEIMRPLRAMGVRLAIDDFGAGHSNLVTLTKLPFDVFKIDQQFVSALHSDKQAPAVVEMILAMAETMGLETVAEGVETPSQSDFLRRRGCTLAQGYLYSKPIPPDEFIEFLANWRPFGEVVDDDILHHLTAVSE